MITSTPSIPPEGAALLAEIGASRLLEIDQPSLLRYNSFLDVYVAPCASPTIATGAGRLEVFRNWHGLRYGLGKIKKALFDVPLRFVNKPCGFWSVPSDSLIHIKSGGEVVVILSASKGRAWKFDRSIHAATSIEKMTEAWNAFREAGMSEFMPEVYASGKLDADGIYFCESALVKNTTPLFRTQHGDQWPATLRDQVVPLLQRFHERNGFKLVTGREWAAHIRQGFEGRSVPASMEKQRERDLEMMASISDRLMPLCMISGDLQPQNVYFYKGRVQFLDWSNIKAAALATDVFCDVFYHAMGEPRTPASQDFWDFLGRKKEAPDPKRRLSRLCGVWRDWMAAWFGFNVTNEILRIQLRGMCWDWMITMDHPWLFDGSLWEEIQFPQVFLEGVS